MTIDSTPISPGPPISSPGSGYQQWVTYALKDEPLPRADAISILQDKTIDLLLLIHAAGRVRQHYFGRQVQLHQINNIRSGLCPEDCGYCSQSSISNATINKYKMKDADAIVQQAHEARARGVYRYCMVASGRGPSDQDTQFLSHVIQRIRSEVGIRTCLSVGLVNQEQADQFKAAGLDRLNHNLNTSNTHTTKIVKTHADEDRVDTIKAAHHAGLGVCSGMITGMGETDEDIVDVAYELQALAAPSIPINFLIPIEGNPVREFGQLTPQRCLRILSLFRFLNPRAEIRAAAGREGHLRGLQSLALYPANSLFVDGYLTTDGDKLQKVQTMIEDAGFEVVDNE